MIKYLPAFLILFCFLFSTNLEAQRYSKKKVKYPQFQGGALFGVNLSQMDGDFFTGFDKSGYYTGLRGIVKVAPKLAIHMELLFSQKGSEIPHGTFVTNQQTNDRIVALNYAEVPLLLRIQLDKPDRGGFIEIGGSFSRLIRTSITEKPRDKIKDTVYTDIAEEFKSFDYNAVVGIGLSILKDFEIALRYNFATNKFYENDNLEPYNPLSGVPKKVAFLRNYYISIFAAYNLRVGSKK